jgi:hypothetical protein
MSNRNGQPIQSAKSKVKAARLITATLIRPALKLLHALLYYDRKNEHRCLTPNRQNNHEHENLRNA